jgi:hypothetical protein
MAGKRYIRRRNIRETKKLFLIVCEGAKTEPNYFRAFPIEPKTREIEGFGLNTLSLVDKALELKKGGLYDQVWCVFDKDSFTDDQFARAITKADNNGLRVGHTNESFELWYLLHFQFMDSALHRDAYKPKLDVCLNRNGMGPYFKNDPDMYEKLQRLQLQQDAIRHAERLIEFHRSNGHAPHQSNPSTTVHLLVQELNKNLR